MINKPLILILSIIGVIAVLAVGCLGGILFQTQKAAPQAEKSEELIELMSSKMVPSVVAVGEVTAISGRNITLRAHTNQDESLTVPIVITRDAELSSFVITTEEDGTIILGGPSRETIKFKDIKVGDNVNVSLKISSDGTFQGVSVIVFPSITR